MTDTREIKWFMRIGVVHSKKRIFMNKSLFIKKVIKRLNLLESKTKSVPFLKGVEFIQLFRDPNSEKTFEVRYRDFVWGLLNLIVWTLLNIAILIFEMSLFLSNSKLDN